MILDPIREKFVAEYQATGNASEALRRAKPKALNWKPETVTNKASAMLREPNVQARLSELQATSAEKHGITLESITQMLLKDREFAYGTNKASAAVTAAMGIAKLHGLVVDKAEHTGKDGAPLVPVINVSVGRSRP